MTKTWAESIEQLKTVAAEIPAALNGGAINISRTIQCDGFVTSGVVQPSGLLISRETAFIAKAAGRKARQKSTSKTVRKIKTDPVQAFPFLF